MKKLLFSLLACIISCSSLSAVPKINAEDMLRLSTLPEDPAENFKFAKCEELPNRLKFWKSYKAQTIKWKEKRMKLTQKFKEGKNISILKAFGVSEHPDFRVVDAIIAKIDLYVKYLNGFAKKCAANAHY